MKFFIALSVLLCAASAFDVFEVPEEDAWEEFKISFSKVFASKSGENKRKKNFMANREKCLELKQKEEAGLISYSPRLYEHADLSAEEFAERYGGYEHIQSDAPVNYTTIVNVRQRPPRSFDARGRLNGAVKHQGTCGSCWTFSAMACIEAGLANKGHGSFDLSEQHLVDCGNSGRDGCKGGRMENAFEYLSQNGGAMQEQEYPYTGVYKGCNVPFVQRGIAVTGPVFPEPTVENIKAALVKYGTLAIAIDCNPWQLYGGGIFKEDQRGRPNHAVNLVGYGTDDGQDYWLVRNSWGEGFGENGHIRLSCGTGGGYDLRNTWAVELPY